MPTQFRSNAQTVSLKCPNSFAQMPKQFCSNAQTVSRKCPNTNSFAQMPKQVRSNAQTVSLKCPKRLSVLLFHLHRCTDSSSCSFKDTTATGINQTPTHHSSDQTANRPPKQLTRGSQSKDRFILLLPRVLNSQHPRHNGASKQPKG